VGNSLEREEREIESYKGELLEISDIAIEENHQY